MFKLKFDESRCLTCPDGACLVKCQYMNFDRNSAREEMVKIYRGEYSRCFKTVSPAIPVKNTADGAIIPST
jgi:Fe-S-cluster-containing dehydrogenase component